MRKRSSSPRDRTTRKKSKWDLPSSEFESNLPPGVITSVVPAVPPTPTEDRRGRRLYVGNIPARCSDSSVAEFFNGALLAAAGVDYSVAAAANQFPVVKAEIGPRRTDANGFPTEHRYCFVEFRTIADATICLRLDSINFNGCLLKIGRPNDTTNLPPATEKSTGEQLAAALKQSRLKSLLRETKVHVRDLPPKMQDEELRAVGERVGPVRTAVVAYDLRTGASTGYGLIEFENPAHVDEAVERLDKLEIDGHTVRFTKKPLIDSSALSETQVAAAGGCTDRSANLKDLPSAITHRVFSNGLVGAQVLTARTEGANTSRVVQLLNCVFPEDLMDDGEYELLLAEIKREASVYGTLLDCRVPRPPADLKATPGVGKVFLFYEALTAARRAQVDFNGRKFDNRRVVCAAFFPEETFLQDKYTLIL